MAKKFIIEKETEYKNGQVSNWYYIKLQTDNSTQVIDLVRDDEKKANERLEEAIKSWVPSSKTVIKEVVVEA
jgi:hypothetical protein